MRPERERAGLVARRSLPARQLPAMQALKIGGSQEAQVQGAGADCRLVRM